MIPRSTFKTTEASRLHGMCFLEHGGLAGWTRVVTSRMASAAELAQAGRTRESPMDWTRLG